MKIIKMSSFANTRHAIDLNFEKSAGKFDDVIKVLFYGDLLHFLISLSLSSFTHSSMFVFSFSLP